MSFNIPSFANDYEFVVCWAFKGENVFSLYSVCDRQIEADTDCERVRAEGLNPLVIHNFKG